jgi:lipopolysaccharide/colanic/teichoic acid biosynthesis glycosyltransferase
VSATPETAAVREPILALESLDERTREIVAHRLRASRPRRRNWLIHRSLAAADTVGLLVAFLVAMAAFNGEGGDVALVGETALFMLLLPFWILLAKLAGLYDQDEERTDHSTVDDIAGVFNVVTIGTWLLFLISQALDSVNPALGRIVVFWLLAIAVVPLGRGIARALCRRSVAYVQNTAASDLRELVRALDVERIVVSFTDDGPERTLSLVRSLRDLDVQIDIVPRLYEAVGTNSTVHMIGGMPLVGLPPIGLSPSSRFLKRLFDLTGATLGVILLSPILVGVAIAIKLESRGPVFFRQLRRGELEKTFQIYKFRTMVADAEAQKSELVHLNMHADDDPRMFKIPNDPRLTRVGGFLRRTSLDELPQLINVLKGEMSLVGPRPLILEEDDHVLDWARKRLELRPGITGLWQVLGRSDIPFGEMTQLDYLYVTSWSLKADIRLIFLTLPSLWRQRRAY